MVKCTCGNSELVIRISKTEIANLLKAIWSILYEVSGGETYLTTSLLLILIIAVSLGTLIPTSLKYCKTPTLSVSEEIIKASREYAMNKSNENNTWFVDYKDIEEAFVAGAYFAFAYLVTSNNTERRADIWEEKKK